MQTFLKTLEEQRWDDHRYYHQSRINQSLHFISACSFLCTYALLFTRVLDPMWGLAGDVTKVFLSLASLVA